jgi:glutamine synthetase
MNPYIALAAALAGIGHGIEQQLPPPLESSGDAYQDPKTRRVPNDLAEATRLLHDSALARDWLGQEFVDYYEETRFWETEQHRLAVTDWELERYL